MHTLPCNDRPRLPTLALWTLLTAAALQGCAAMAKLDKALAPKSTTSQPAKGTEVNPAAEDQAATPIVETAAATLAALGFGGLAYWTRRVSKAWQQAHGEQCQAHADLQSQVDALKPARPALPLSPRIIGDSNNGPGLQTDQ